MKTATDIPKRYPPEMREALLLESAMEAAAKHGLYTMTRDQIAEVAGVSPSLISHRLGTMPAMRRSVMRQAVSRGDSKMCLSIIAQGLAARDPHALKAPPPLQAKALATLKAA